MHKYRFYAIITAFLLLLISCDRHSMAERLSSIDSLIAIQRYDSAFKLTNGIDRHKLANEDDLAHYWLLDYQTRYLTNKILPSDSILDKAIRHYTKACNSGKLSDCYFYKASRLYWDGAYKPSVVLLKKAEKLAAEAGDASRRFKVAELLSSINSVTGNYTTSLEYGRQALRFARAVGRKDWVAYSYHRIGHAYNNLGKADSAMCCFTLLEPYIKYVRQEDRPYFLSNLSLVYIDENPQKSKELLLEALSQEELVGALEQLAEIYYEEGNHNEAYKLWTKALAVNSRTPKDNILHNLLEYDVEHGHTDKVCERVNSIIAIKDSIIGHLRNDTIKDLQLRFDHEAAMNVASRRLLRLQQALAAGVITFLIIGIIWIWKRNKDEDTVRQHESQVHNLILRLEGQQSLMRDLERRIEALKKAHQGESLKMEELSRELDRLRAERDNAQRQANELNQKIEEWAGTESWKVRQGVLLMEELQENKSIRHWPGDKLEALVAYYCALHPNVGKKIRLRKRPLSAKESLYLILSDMGKTKEEMSTILGVEKDTLRSYKLRISRKD